MTRVRLDPPSWRAMRCIFWDLCSRRFRAIERLFLEARVERLKRRLAVLFVYDKRMP